MVHVGVDYGRKTIGLALHREGLVLPLPELHSGGWRGLETRLRSVLEEQGEGKIVIGLPLSAGGGETEHSSEVRGLARWLRERGFDVELCEERGTTAEARSLLSGADGLVDSVSAVLILKRYLSIP